MVLPASLGARRQDMGGRRQRKPSRESRRISLLLLLVLITSLVALFISTVQAASPQVKVSRFANLPAKLTHLDDTSVVLYHDSIKGEVWRSEDEGKSWKSVDERIKGSAYLLVEHPHDRNMIFILSNAKKHWRSTDRGKSWHPFETPEAPAVRAGAPLEFNADEKHYGNIIFTGKKCSAWTPWGVAMCHDVAYYTTDAFATTPKPLVEYLMHCTWAKSSKDVHVKPEHLERIYCIAWEDSPTGMHTKRSHNYDGPDHLLSSRSAHQEMQRRAPAGSPTRLFLSDDYYASKKMVEFDLGRDAKDFVGFGASKRYLVTALRDIKGSSGGSVGSAMALFVSKDGDEWKKAEFPHGAGLTEGAYTIVEGTTHSLVVDVLDTTLGGTTGTLFTSDSAGVYFVKSLEGTSRSIKGIVDYEHLANIEGVSLANVRADIHMGGSEHGTGTKSVITFDDGSSWNLIKPPADSKCGNDINKCSLHLHSVTRPHNTGRVFSSFAPGFVMGVGSVGDVLLPYESSDTFLSTDAGRTWTKTMDEAHKYEFGDQGSVLVVVDDEVSTDFVSYSWNRGKNWEKLKLGLSMRARILTTIPDGTAQKFLLIGSQTVAEAKPEVNRQVAVFLDFAGTKRLCDADKDFEQWDASAGKCLMGHKQIYKRRKADADCYVGDKFRDPVSSQDPCPCTEEDYECDFGHVRDQKGICVQTGRDVIPPGECLGGAKSFKGSSGYRKIPGNTCDHSRGVKKDDAIDKPCEGGAPSDGQVFHQTHEFAGEIIDHAYFSNSGNVMVHIDTGNIWTSLNDGLSWNKIELEVDGHYPDTRFFSMVMHPYDKMRGYLLTTGQRFKATKNKGVTWETFSAPIPPNQIGLGLLQFHPTKSDWLIWTGSTGDCTTATSTDCHTAAWYTKDEGRNWNVVDKYVRTCNWLSGSAKFQAVDPTAIICESYTIKQGNQRTFDASNPLQLVLGTNFYAQKRKLFDAVEGFAVFDEFLVTAEYQKASDTITLMISMDGIRFAPAQFPPNTKLERRAYTLLESNTNSIFMHGTTHSKAGSEWGALFRSNWNGTFYTTSLEHVNRNANGYVDFEKMLGLEGIALANIVSNPDEAILTGNKDYQTRITHNDAGRWKLLTPPPKDANGEPQKCGVVGCDLQLHGYTEREDSRATYSSPSAVGVMMGVGNVGKKLAPYKDSDTFLTRDGGFTWEEVKKDAHKWEFGDQGSIIVLVNDEDYTNLVSYTLDQGLTWREYSFQDKLRVKKIVTVPEDTHRKFIVFGSRPSATKTAVAVHLDFTGLQTRKCDANKDFDLWSPSEEANDMCLFGREVKYPRRKRDADCYVGREYSHSIIRNCTCTAKDFECNFGYRVDPSDSTKCIAYQGVTPLAADADVEIQCRTNDYWYERTSVRKVPHSSCDGGSRPDRGTQHICSNSLKRHGWFWWLSLVCLPFGLAALVGVWWNQRNQRLRGGAIRLGGGNTNGDSKLAQTIASVPYYVAGIAGQIWSEVLIFAERIPILKRTFGSLSGGGQSRFGGYRTLRVNEMAHDEDAEILRTYEEEEEE